MSCAIIMEVVGLLQFVILVLAVYRRVNLQFDVIGYLLKGEWVGIEAI